MIKAIAATLIGLVLVASQAAMAQRPQTVQSLGFAKVDRLLLDTGRAARKGSISPSRLYNDGSGYMIPGLPRGDSIIGLPSSGVYAGRLSFPYMSIYDRAGYRSLDGNSTVYCHIPENIGLRGFFPEPGYGVFRPLAVDRKRTVSSTRINMTLGVQQETVTRLRVARDFASVERGFSDTLNDHLLLEVSEGSLWAWPHSTGFTDDPPMRTRLARLSTTPRLTVAMEAYELGITLQRYPERCTLDLNPVGRWLSLESVSLTLAPEYCSVGEQNDTVIALTVLSNDSTEGNYTQLGAACLSHMRVASTLSRR